MSTPVALLALCLDGPLCGTDGKPPLRAVAEVARLRAENPGAVCAVLTTRSPQLYDATREWIDSYYPGMQGIPIIWRDTIAAGLWAARRVWPGPMVFVGDLAGVGLGLADVAIGGW